MKTYRIFILFVFYLFFYCFFSPQVYAQAKKNQKWVCLQTPEKTVIENGKEKKVPISCGDAAAGCSGKGVSGHRVKLSAKPDKKPANNVDLYILVCVFTDNKQICTTGKQDIDNVIYGKWEGTTLSQSATNLAELASTNFAFEGMYKADGETLIDPPSPVKTSATGEIGPYEWQDSTKPPGNQRKWMGLWYENPVGGAGDDEGVKQGTFSFDDADRSCAAIGWDPYGRVFDSETLEPVSGAQVALYVKRGDSFIFFDPYAIENQPNSIINPQIVRDDGQYNFVIPDGDYKLLVAPSPLTTITTLHPNYTKAYYDIYPSMTGDLIKQRGTIEHRDIPVPTSSRNATPKMIEYYYEANPSGKITIQGRVSHPLSKLIASTSKVSTKNPANVTPYRPIGIFYSDKWGVFDIRLDQSTFEKTEDYMEIFTDLEIVKVDLRTLAKHYPTGLYDKIVRSIKDLFNKQVEAQAKTSIVKFNPIPQFLEGYAYDSEGKPIPNATVGVYLTFSKQAYSEVTANQSGFFQIPQENLPPFSYVIKYTSATGKTIETSTTKFLAQNQKFISQNKIDPLVGNTVNNQQALYRPTPGIDVSVKQTTDRDASYSSASSSKDSTRTNFTPKRSVIPQSNSQKNVIDSAAGISTLNPMIPTVILLILLLGGVGIGILFYIKNKQTSTVSW